MDYHPKGLPKFMLWSSTSQNVLMKNIGDEINEKSQLSLEKTILSTTSFWMELQQFSCAVLNILRNFLNHLSLSCLG